MLSEACIASKTINTFNAQKATKDVFKTVHVTTVVHVRVSNCQSHAPQWWIIEISKHLWRNEASLLKSRDFGSFIRAPNHWLETKDL